MAGFFSKLYILISVVESKLYFLAIVAVITSVVSAFYYLKIIKVIFFDIPQNNLLKDLYYTENLFYLHFQEKLELHQEK